ncbi:MAG: helix-turn-helix domain-containing protein [Myxococcales bacterium]|nr:helix-turn-helix domain-containing protein [Myxococcales bacterium]
MSTAQSPGTVLREAREAQGLSIRTLAAVTKISPKVLEALENDQYDAAPAEVFVRGFIRGCARELRLDADELMAHYFEYTGQAVPMSSVEESEDQDHQSVAALFEANRLPRTSYVVAVLAILLGLGLSILIFGDSSTPEYTESHAEESTTTNF